jgi:hypothetical protein
MTDRFPAPDSEVRMSVMGREREFAAPNSGHPGGYPRYRRRGLVRVTAVRPRADIARSGGGSRQRAESESQTFRDLARGLRLPGAEMQRKPSSASHRSRASLRVAQRVTRRCRRHRRQRPSCHGRRHVKTRSASGPPARRPRWPRASTRPRWPVDAKPPLKNRKHFSSPANQASQRQVGRGALRRRTRHVGGHS